MPDYESVQVTFTTLVALCAIVMAFWGVWKVVKEIKQPNLKRDEEIDTIKDHLDRDNRRLKDLEEASRLQLRAQLVIIEHLTSADGNHLEQLKSVRNEIQTYLINR